MLVLMLLMPCVGNTQEVKYVGINIGSWHSESAYNNSNPGAYVVFTNGWGGGVYRNSVRNISLHVERTWCYEDTACVSVGLVSGYPKYGPVAPLVLPNIKLGPIRIFAFKDTQVYGLSMAVEKEF